MAARYSNTPQWNSSMDEVNALSDEALMAAVSSMKNPGKFIRNSLVKAPKRQSTVKSIDVNVLDEVWKRLFDVDKK